MASLAAAVDGAARRYSGGAAAALAEEGRMSGRDWSTLDMVDITTMQTEAAAWAAHHEAVVFCVDEYLTVAVPEMPAADRDDVAREIALGIRANESVDDACRRVGRESVKAAEEEASKATRLGEGLNNNDVGNGERFAEQHASTFRFLDDRKIWLKWDRRRWCLATDGQINRAAKVTAKRMLAKALEKPEEERKVDQAHALATLANKGLINMIACARSEKIFSASMAEFDQDPDLLTVENGTLNLRTGELRPHDRGDMMTTLTKIKYDPSAPAPRWRQFVREIFGGDEKLVNYVQRAVGYTLTGHTKEQKFFLLHGLGSNGKGSFVRLLVRLLGDAGCTTSFDTFATKRSGGPSNTPELAQLAGKRFVTAGEPDQSVRLSESIIKLITGEDNLRVCAKYEDPFEYRPRFKLWLHCNHRPEIRGTDLGIWRRPQLIPFTQTFDGAEGRPAPDPDLEEKLVAELPGILAWAIEGAREWYRSGLGAAPAVVEATAQYRAESDVLAPFIEDCLVMGADKFVASVDLATAYQGWCRAQRKEKVMEPDTLYKRMAARGFVRGKDAKGQRRGFKGVELSDAGKHAARGFTVRNGEQERKPNSGANSDSASPSAPIAKA
jgi:putative DNA primase/helicase